ncbi:Hypothetical predicted protein [Cloeon dipterum]|uniref:Uncharacterized protein n=1 Tax=Cloeon dipterum TaxID=197152 RepID=A0A8S1DJW3_9INSE|nr:Hypothetical predicted protein [Cloeon dipterum]
MFNIFSIITLVLITEVGLGSSYERIGEVVLKQTAQKNLIIKVTKIRREKIIKCCGTKSCSSGRKRTTNSTATQATVASTTAKAMEMTTAEQVPVTTQAETTLDLTTEAATDNNNLDIHFNVHIYINVYIHFYVNYNNYYYNHNYYHNLNYHHNHNHNYNNNNTLPKHIQRFKSFYHLGKCKIRLQQNGYGSARFGDEARRDVLLSISPNFG